MIFAYIERHHLIVSTPDLCPGGMRFNSEQVARLSIALLSAP
jgi:hypothetical protein